MIDGGISGFERRRRVAGDGVEIDLVVGGCGPPVLLLHGFPQTRVCWARVAPVLAERFTVVVPDLRGYGRSGKPDGRADRMAYSKRTMARDQVATMAALGFSRFAVAGHDRGGRVAYRLALDHPGVVSRLAVLDVVPNVEAGAKIWHWMTDWKPDGSGGDAEEWLRWVLESQAGRGFRFDPASVADYLAACSDAEAMEAMCADFSAGMKVDRQLDDGDWGKRRIAAPVLCLWAEKGVVAGLNPLEVWKAWADEVRGKALACGHFLPEEASAEVAAALGEWFAE